MTTVTPSGLLLTALLGCGVAALFGAQPLARWAADNVPALQQAMENFQSLTADFGLGRPYDWLRHAVRDAEAARFTPPD